MQVIKLRQNSAGELCGCIQHLAFIYGRRLSALYVRKLIIYSVDSTQGYVHVTEAPQI